MSHEQEPADREVDDLEAMLGALSPARSGVDRDRVMFEAGRASARRTGNSQRAWALVSGILAMVSIGEGALLARRSGLAESRPMADARPVVASAGATVVLSRQTEASDRADMPGPLFVRSDSVRDRLVAQVLRYGLDGLPSSVPAEWGESSRPILQSHGALPEDLRKELELEGPS